MARQIALTAIAERRQDDAAASNETLSSIADLKTT
jgi:hypothetical protein